MNDSDKSLAILNILDSLVLKARNEDVSWLYNSAAEPHTPGTYFPAAGDSVYRIIHKRLTDAEELYFFAVRCFIERAYHADKT